MDTADEWITNLALASHPEGGFYREVYRSPELLLPAGLPTRFDGPRNFSTSIYYLLRSGDKSHFHRLKSDEIWYFHSGSALTLVMLNEDRSHSIRLGNKIAHGETLQYAIPANTWFGAYVSTPDSYALCSCHVAPGFDFHDFEMGSRSAMLQQFPQSRMEIEMLTRP